MLKHNVIIPGPSDVTYAQVLENNLRLGPCRSCLLEMDRLSSPPSKSDHTTDPPFFRVCGDIIGRTHTLDRHRSQYILFLMDECTGFIAVYYMKQKSEVLRYLKEFYESVVLAFGWRLRQLRFDSDPQFQDHKVKSWAHHLGCHITFSPPYHHKGNGAAERNIRTLMSTARRLATSAGRFFRRDDSHYYISMAAYLLNRTSRKRCGLKTTPYQQVTGKKADLSNAVPVGSRGFAHIYDEERVQGNKLEQHAAECVFLGYVSDVPNAHIVRINGRDMVRRDVTFFEFPSSDLEFLETMTIIERAALDDDTLDRLIPTADGDLPSSIELLETEDPVDLPPLEPSNESPPTS
jgi:hypothetical protein